MLLAPEALRCWSQAAASQYGRHTLFSLSALTEVGLILSLGPEVASPELGLTCRKAEASMSPDPELLRFLGLSSESVSEAVVSSSLMLDLVEDGVGGEVRGAARTDLKQKEGISFVTCLIEELFFMLTWQEGSEGS